MKPKALFIGSIGAVAETSEIQRQSYNQAMKENGVNWDWDIAIYKKLLQTSGGQDRLETLALATGQNLPRETIEKIHARKTELAGQKIVADKIAPRPGLVDLIKNAIKDGVQVAWVTTTGHENTDAILTAFDGKLDKPHFNHIFHREDAANGKPSPDIYHAALKKFNLEARDCIAIEDSLDSVLSAKGAGIFTIVAQGAYHDEPVVNIANVVVDSLDQIKWMELRQAYEKALIVA